MEKTYTESDEHERDEYMYDDEGEEDMARLRYVWVES